MSLFPSAPGRFTQMSTGAWRDAYSFLAAEKLVCVADADFGYWELKDRMLEGMAAGLHATLPLMNLTQRLVVSHFLGRKFGSVWGRPAPDLGDAKWDPPIADLQQK